MLKSSFHLELIDFKQPIALIKRSIELCFIV
jgi:hypothetical protein